MSVIPAILCAALLTGDGRTVPDLDLALASADVVVAGRLERSDAGDRVRVVEVLAGTTPGPTLPLADLSRLGVHYHVPATGRTHLLFLHRLHTGWGVHQRPGCAPVWDAASAADLRVLLRSLAELRSRLTLGAVAAHVRLATDLARRDSRLAASALRALARRPSLLAGLDPASRATLSDLLQDPGAHVALRDHAARCLVGTGSPEAPMLLIGLLTSGTARDLGPLFGRLLYARLRERSVTLLRDALPRCRAGGHEEVLRAAWATGRTEARDWVRSVRSDPVLLRAGTGR